MAQLTLIRRSERSRTDWDESRLYDKQVSPLRLVLKVVENEQLISVPLADRLTAGRGGSGHRPDVDLGDFDSTQYGISRWHAVFTYADSTLFVEDLNSRNGTRINGYQIEAGKPFHLRNGDELELGTLRLLVRVVRPAG